MKAASGRMATGSRSLRVLDHVGRVIRQLARLPAANRRSAGAAMVRAVNVTGNGAEWEEGGHGQFYSGNGREQQESSVAVVTITIVQSTVVVSGTSTGACHGQARPVFIGSNLQWSAKGIRISTCGFCPGGCPTGSCYPTIMGLGYARHQGGMLERYLHRRERMGPGLMLQMAGASYPGKGTRSSFQEEQCAGRRPRSSARRPGTGPGQRHEFFYFLTSILRLFLSPSLWLSSQPINRLRVTKKAKGRKHTKPNRP
jgi:hypothetical protein